MTEGRTETITISAAEKVAGDNENGRKLSKKVESTVGKGEIARYEQFVLFAQCFQKDLYWACSEKGYILHLILWKKRALLMSLKHLSLVMLQISKGSCVAQW